MIHTHTMDTTLPHTPQDDGASQPPVAPQMPIGSHGKEAEPVASGMTPVEHGNIVMEIGKDVELSPEVASSGVRVQQSTVEISKPVRAMGVTPTGHAPISSTSAGVPLPLSDEQIAQGLHQDITTSWRWLAEWCVRKLKQVHMAIRVVRGAPVRVQE